MKFSVHLLIAAGLASLPGSAQPHMDFRKTTWGMTKAQVLAAESNPPGEVRESNGEVVVRYDSIKLAGLDGAPLDINLVYIFAKDKLVRAKYLLDTEHNDLNDFIADYHAVEPVLRSTYGEPTGQRVVWEDDSLQEERKSYLDQDRALPENILPSDRNVGLAVSLGHLKLYTDWGDSRTKVLHALTGADGRITHQIEYRSVELGAFEDEVRRQSAIP
jgi:hypothetical protein